MGNIFKTLGLDDLARQFIPGIGGAIADQLNNLPLGQKSGPGANSGNMLNTSMGKTDGRMSNEDYQFNQDLLDSSAPREAARTNTIADITTPNEIKNRSAFLSGVAPAEADAYNIKQDATFGADTQRGIDRTLAEAKQLGMSPWELKGQSGASPLQGPTGSPQQGQRQQSGGGEFLSTMTPLAIAKMNNQTSLKQTKMQNETALKQTEMQTGMSKYLGDQSTNNGELPRHQTAKTAADTTLSIMQTSKTSADTNLSITQAALAENQMWLNSVTTMLQALPEINLDFGVFKSKEKDGWRGVLQMLGTADKQNLMQALSKATKSMPKSQFDDLTKDVIKLAGMFSSGAKGAMNTVASLEGLMLTVKNMLK